MALTLTFPLTSTHMALFGLLSLVVALVVLLLYRLFVRSPRRNAPLRTMAVLGSGGHTMEMQRLLCALDCKYSPLILVVAADDKLSREKAAHSFTSDTKPVVELIRRSRGVGQSYISSVWTTLVAFVDALLLVVRTNPDLVICNGPGTCVPVCVAAKFYSRSTVVFAESFCRVNSLSPDWTPALLRRRPFSGSVAVSHSLIPKCSLLWHPRVTSCPCAIHSVELDFASI